MPLTFSHYLLKLFKELGKEVSYGDGFYMRGGNGDLLYPRRASIAS